MGGWLIHDQSVIDRESEVKRDFHKAQKHKKSLNGCIN